MTEKKIVTGKKNTALLLYLMMAGVFIACIVTGNLIFQKFFFWAPLRFLDFGTEEGSIWFGISHYTFNVSVGIIPYPLTFLITDLVSEIYGRKKADLIVYAGLISIVIVLIIVAIADMAPATSFSPLNDEVFTQVFGLTGLAVTASMIAYLLAQLVDIRIFHLLKRLTKGKMLWVRNNFSTITSQLIDTSVVLILLCFFGALDWNLFWGLLVNGILFKALMALLDTPFFYFFSGLLRKKFKLQLNEEVEL